jgi:hypothetical protein
MPRHSHPPKKGLLVWMLPTPESDIDVNRELTSMSEFVFNHVSLLQQLVQAPFHARFPVFPYGIRRAFRAKRQFRTAFFQRSERGWKSRFWRIVCKEEKGSF